MKNMKNDTKRSNLKEKHFTPPSLHQCGKLFYTSTLGPLFKTPFHKTFLFTLLLFFTTFLVLSCDDELVKDDTSVPLKDDTPVPPKDDTSVPLKDDTPVSPIADFKAIIKSKKLPAKSALSTSSEVLQSALGSIVGDTARSVEVVYVSPSGGSDAAKDGSTWDKAYAAMELKTAIDGAAATADTPYLILVTPGTYDISTTLSMKNNVLIAGGISEDGSLSTAETILDGGGTTQVFNNNTSLSYSAGLYGVTITGGKATDGGGMFNNDSNPNLTKVTFDKNTADQSGGGMFNNSSSPSFTEVIFSANAAATGGGILNSNSSPNLAGVTFDKNTATALGNDLFNEEFFLEVGLNAPGGMAIDTAGNLYVADRNNHRIRKITPAGVITPFAGNGTAGFADGQGTAAQFNGPIGIAIDTAGNLYVADDKNHRIRKITPAGKVTTLAGNGAGFADGKGTAAQFNKPSGIAIDTTGNLYVADYTNHRIRKITPAGAVTTLAGSGTTGGFANGQGTAARFNGPIAIAVAPGGDIYVAEFPGLRIRKITPAGAVTTLAGGGTTAKFTQPLGIAIGGAGNLYVTDVGTSSYIRKVTPSGAVSTVLGLSAPYGIVFSPDATTLYSTSRNRIKKFSWR